MYGVFRIWIILCPFRNPPTPLSSPSMPRPSIMTYIFPSHLPIAFPSLQSILKSYPYFIFSTAIARPYPFPELEGLHSGVILWKHRGLTESVMTDLVWLEVSIDKAHSIAGCSRKFSQGFQTYNENDLYQNVALIRCIVDKSIWLSLEYRMRFLFV